MNTKLSFSCKLDWKLFPALSILSLLYSTKYCYVVVTFKLKVNFINRCSEKLLTKI